MAMVVRPRGRWFPRTRGDRPQSGLDDAYLDLVSPHTRGSTCGEEVVGQQRDGFPAHAGIDPGLVPRGFCPSRFPRTRGDRPTAHEPVSATLMVSPHTRGSTLR